MQHNSFSRFVKLVGNEAIEILKNKSVLVLGVGGVGGYVCEALARSGIGNLIIVDYDVVDYSNINRQIIALNSTIGLKKVDVLEKRIKDINPNCNVIKIDKFIDCDNICELFSFKIDFFIDCCDTVSTKKKVIDECLNNDILFISSMGTGNKFDPSLLEITDIRKTVNDPLARIMRKYVKDSHIKKKVIVLSSKEVPMKISDRVVGSTAFVPSSAGLLIASYVVRKFINKKC